VMGFTELLIGAERRANVLADLEQIRTDAGRAAKIVHNLLLFARRETLERSVADFNEIVRTTLSLRSFELRTRNITLGQEYSVDVPLVIANREQIQQVVLNLVLNAEYAIRSAGSRGSINVRTGHEEGSAFVDISDDGPGVPADVAGRIFEPFFTTKDIGEGTGLGLSVSLGIAESHSGLLALMPSERGACFRLTLPGATVGRIDHDAVSARA
jgi:signal transduction histidine kinase